VEDPAPPAQIAAAPPDAPARRTAGAIIFLIVFLDLLGVGLIVPLSPYIVEQFDMSAMSVAWLAMSYSAAQFLATPILGALSDRYGRRPILIWSLFGTMVGYVVFAMAHSLPLLFAARALDGATGGNISTAQAAIADVTPREQRAKAYGLVGAAFGLGFTLGPAISGLLIKLSGSLMTPVWAAAGLSLFTLTLVAYRLPETHPHERRRREHVRARDLNPFRSLLQVAKIPALGWLLLAIFLYNFAHAELRAAFGVLLRDKLSFTEELASWMFAYMGLLAIFVQGGLVRRLAPILGDRRTALIGLPIAAIGYALLPLGGTWHGVGAALTVLALGGGLASPTITSMLSGAADASVQGAAMGASQSVAALALVIGPLVAGNLYDHVGRGWPFWTGAGVVALAFGIIAGRGVIRPADASGAAPASEPAA
jgi:predicted MFS family arabinose efflux permease